MPRRLFLIFAFGAVLVCGAARAQDWRFCVGVAPASHETLITDIFASSADTVVLQHRLEAWFRANRGRDATFQCPRGAAERIEVLNAQTKALQFNRQMGYAVTGLSSAEAAAIVGGER